MITILVLVFAYLLGLLFALASIIEVDTELFDIRGYRNYTLVYAAACLLSWITVAVNLIILLYIHIYKSIKHANY